MVTVPSVAIRTTIAPAATQLLINNRWVSSESGETFATLNPSTGEEICQVAAAGAADVEMAVQAARKAFEEGLSRKMPASERDNCFIVSPTLSRKMLKGFERCLYQVS